MNSIDDSVANRKQSSSSLKYGDDSPQIQNQKINKILKDYYDDDEDIVEVDGADLDESQNDEYDVDNDDHDDDDDVEYGQNKLKDDNDDDPNMRTLTNENANCRTYSYKQDGPHRTTSISKNQPNDDLDNAFDDLNSNNNNAIEIHA